LTSYRTPHFPFPRAGAGAEERGEEREELVLPKVVMRGRGQSTYQMRIPQLLNNTNVVEFDVEELVDGLEGAADGDVVFELDGDGVVDEGFEEAVGCGFRVVS